MRKRLFWLTLLLAGLLAWVWLRQRRDEFAEMATQLAPPQPAPPQPRAISEAELAALFDDTAAASSAARETIGEPAEAHPAPALDPLAREAVLPPPAEAVTQPDLVAARETVELPPSPTAELLAGASDAPVEAGAPEEDDDLTDADTLEGMTAYCVRCRTKRAMVDPREEITETGRRAARGTCPVCGTTTFRFLKGGD